MLFLLYGGPFVLQDVLPLAQYKLFLLLHISCKILNCKKLCRKYLNHTRLYLRKFVELVGEMYGEEFFTCNFHNLIYLPDDVENMDCTLSDICTFAFESKFGDVKKNVNSGTGVQLARK